MAIWVRRNSKGEIVEKTASDPSNKYHPSIVWEKFEDAAGKTVALTPTIASTSTYRDTIAAGMHIFMTDEELAQLEATAAEQPASDTTPA